MDKYLLYHDVMDALQYGACPVCSLVRERIERAIKVTLREGFSDDELRGSYIRAKGYCNHHAWQMREAGDPAAHAMMYRGLLEEHKASLERYMELRARRGMADHRDHTLGRIKTLIHSVGGDNPAKVSAETEHYLDSFSSNKPCPLCETAESCEARYVGAIAEYYEGDEEFKERYRNRGVLCHPHLRRLIREHSHRECLQELLEIQLIRLDTYIEHLSEIGRKTTYQYSEAEIGAERGGWIRAVHLDVGNPGTDTSYKMRMAAKAGIMIKS